MSRFRFPGALLASALLVVSAAAPASADHVYAQGVVRVFRDTTLVASYVGDFVGCGTTCSVTVPLPKRDYNRFVRWCGGTQKSVTVFAENADGNTSCLGPSLWGIAVRAVLLDGSGTTETHPSNVTVTVNAAGL